jgi:ketosteroid isomerase-like protein
MSKQNVDVVRGMYQSFEEGDVPSVLAALNPEVEWNEAESFPYADGNPYVGPDAIVDGVFKRLGTEWEYWKLDIENVLDAGDNIVVLGRYQGAYNANGRTLDAQFAHVWWLRDGKVTRFQQYTDTAQAAKVVGS